MSNDRISAIIDINAMHVANMLDKRQHKRVSAIINHDTGSEALLTLLR